MLNLKHNGIVIATVAEGGWVDLPDGRSIAPAVHGWMDNDGYELETAPVLVVEPTLAEQRAAMQLTFAQLVIGLVTEEWITEPEGEGWLIGTLPTPVLTVIASLPAEMRFAARARATRPSVIMRIDPLVDALASLKGKTSAEIDAFFLTYRNA